MPPDRGRKIFDYIVPVPHIGKGETIEIRGRWILSSNIDWIGWSTKLPLPVMIVQFTGGSRYLYLDVSRQKATACAFAQSSGAYLNKHIKPDHKVVKIR